MSSELEYHRQAVRILRELGDLGVRVDVVEGKVAYEAPAELAPEAYIERVRFVKRHVLELLSEPVYWQRASRDRWCQSCHDASDRGERVLLCSQCDEPMGAS